ncbi:MAG: flagellar hook-length control protein FliK [Proteobacteria bacterium]|nr:flagellar hook-length control protein FliK [Pseudomonadota bacterium]
MLIPLTPQNQVGLVKDIPPNLLANIVVGQRVDAVVLIAALAAEIVKLRVADTIIELKTPVPLTQGQAVQLELVKVDGKLLLQLVPAEKADLLTKLNSPLLSAPQKTEPKAPVGVSKTLDNPVLPSALKVGQQASVEVIKVLANNRLLLATTELTKQEPQQAANKQVANKQVANKQVANKPVAVKQQFEIDISRLNSTFKPNDKLVLEIVSLKPLAIKLKADHSERKNLILEKIRQLLPQQPVAKANLDGLVTAQQKQTLPQPVVKEFSQLLQHVLDKPAIVKPDAFRQAVQNSGVFLERQLLTNPTSNNSDFKANLLRMITVLETVITKSNQSISSEAKVDMKTLPTQVQSALAVLTKMPQDLSKLPAQIQAALAAIGKRPTQLLSLLMASFSSSAESTAEMKPQAETLGPPINKPLIKTEQLPVQTKALATELLVLRSLLREVEGVHAKLQFNQLSMLKDPDSPTSPNVWLMDLPLKDRDRLDMLQLRMEQYTRKSEEEEDTWNVQLTLDTRNLGPLQATINMCGDDIKVMLCAEWPESAVLLEDNMDMLNADLAKLGVNIHHLSCRCGEVSPVTISASNFHQSDALVDISV